MRGGNYLASGIEHNERGAPTASGEVHARMNDKRIRKLDPLKHRRDLFLIEGDPHAPLALVSWGSVAGTAREALEMARREGIQARLLVPKLIFPVAEEVYTDFFRGVQAGLVVEQSHQGQLYRMLRMYVDVPAGMQSLARSGSNPILPASIVVRLQKIVTGLQRKHVAEVEPAG
jgi:2-oxoglutarate ferredoxin oxidoreductase subunit alpha